MAGNTCFENFPSQRIFCCAGTDPKLPREYNSSQSWCGTSAALPHVVRWLEVPLVFIRDAWLVPFPPLISLIKNKLWGLPERGKLQTFLQSSLIPSHNFPWPFGVNAWSLCRASRHPGLPGGQSQAVPIFPMFCGTH